MTPKRIQRRRTKGWRMPENTVYVFDGLSELVGKNLACWCPPELACHTNVLLQLANQPAGGAA
jgi:hypothetical protein